MELSKFRQRIARKVASHKAEVQELKFDTAVELFTELYRLEILDLDDMRLLAGASGNKGDEEDFNPPEGERVDTQEIVIFTGPSDGATLLELLESKDQRRILFAYNRHRITEFYDQGVVVFRCGMESAELMSFGELGELCSTADQEVEIDVDMLPDIYGKYAFKQIAPE